MKFTYSRHISGREQILERVLEILPGAISWSIIIAMLALSFIRPIWAAVIMIAFILYWIMRLLYMNIFLILSYLRLAKEKDTDWMKKIDEIDDATLPQSKDIYQLVIITVIKEGKKIVEPGISAIAKGAYPARRILLVVALEEIAPEEIKKEMGELREKFREVFLDVIIAIHPAGIQQEARVKGANATYAARRAAEYFDKHNIPYENIIVSCFDADTVAQPNYFSCLTYHFIITPERICSSFQPIPVYYNNIWDVPSFARIIDIGTSFFLLIEATNPKRLVTFSSHSMSFKALVEVGYWPADMISDDSGIFWKAFIYYDGNYRTVPIYTTVSMDIATGRNLKQTFLNIYKQKRRWAWGVENFPIVMRAFLRSKTISFYDRFIHGFKLLDLFVSWATWSFLLTFGMWLPAVFARKEFSSSTVFYIAPRIQKTIFSLASFGVIICMAISLLLLPKKNKPLRAYTRILHALEWLFIPVIILVLSALPALDAQTRLMLGRYMEFWVTDKYRNKT